jgi:inhibitor of KinA sporulation pathway (predicted exonuclease)
MPITDSSPWQYKDPILQTWPESGGVIIFDLEYTAWEGSWQRGWSREWEHREIVQIGAVRVDAASDFEQIDRFSRFVQPSHNPQLSDYFTALTGIDQATVDSEGCVFLKAYSEFMQFVGDAEVLLANGTDGEVLRENCALISLEYGLKHGRVINIRPIIASIVSEQVSQQHDHIDSGDLPSVLSILSSTDGGKHNALADAEGIALALRELRRRGAI